MFAAYGRAVQRQADGTLKVVVEYIRESNGQSIGKTIYPYSTNAALKTAVDAQLLLYKQAEDDTTVSAQIVDKLLSRI